MEKYIVLTKKILSKIKSVNELAEYFEKFVSGYTFTFTHNDEKVENEYRLRYYKDAQGRKKTSESYYTKKRGKFVKTEGQVYNGWIMTENLALTLNLVMLKDDGGIIAYPRKSLIGLLKK